MFVLAAGATEVSGRLTEGLAFGIKALTKFSPEGVESEGLAAGRVGLVMVSGVVVVEVAVRGGVEGVGLSRAEGDGALTSSTGLFCKRTEQQRSDSRF